MAMAVLGGEGPMAMRPDVSRALPTIAIHLDGAALQAAFDSFHERLGFLEGENVKLRIAQQQQQQQQQQAVVSADASEAVSPSSPPSSPSAALQAAEKAFKKARTDSQRLEVLRRTVTGLHGNFDEIAAELRTLASMHKAAASRERAAEELRRAEMGRLLMATQAGPSQMQAQVDVAISRALGRVDTLEESSRAADMAQESLRRQMAAILDSVTAMQERIDDMAENAAWGATTNTSFSTAMKSAEATDGPNGSEQGGDREQDQVQTLARDIEVCGVGPQVVGSEEQDQESEHQEEDQEEEEDMQARFEQDVFSILTKKIGEVPLISQLVERQKQAAEELLDELTSTQSQQREELAECMTNLEETVDGVREAMESRLGEAQQLLEKTVDAVVQDLDRKLESSLDLVQADIACKLQETSGNMSEEIRLASQSSSDRAAQLQRESEARMVDEISATQKDAHAKVAEVLSIVKANKVEVTDMMKADLDQIRKEIAVDSKLKESRIGKLEQTAAAIPDTIASSEARLGRRASELGDRIEFLGSSTSKAQAVASATLAAVVEEERSRRSELAAAIDSLEEKMCVAAEDRGALRTAINNCAEDSRCELVDALRAQAGGESAAHVSTARELGKLLSERGERAAKTLEEMEHQNSAVASAVRRVEQVTQTLASKDGSWDSITAKVEAQGAELIRISEAVEEAHSLSGTHMSARGGTAGNLRLSQDALRALAGNTQRVAKLIAAQADYAVICSISKHRSPEKAGQNWDESVIEERERRSKEFLQTVAEGIARRAPSDFEAAAARAAFAKRLEAALKIALSKYTLTTPQSTLFGRIRIQPKACIACDRPFSSSASGRVLAAPGGNPGAASQDPLPEPVDNSGKRSTFRPRTSNGRLGSSTSASPWETESISVAPQPYILRGGFKLPRTRTARLADTSSSRGLSTWGSEDATGSEPFFSSQLLTGSLTAAVGSFAGGHNLSFDESATFMSGVTNISSLVADDPTNSVRAPQILPRKLEGQNTAALIM
jgi:hypothetical protein